MTGYGRGFEQIAEEQIALYGLGRSSNPQEILRYPHVGTPLTQQRTSNWSTPVFYVGAGTSGVVREIWLTVTPYGAERTNAWSDIPLYELRVYSDCGDVATLSEPPATSLTCRMPLAQLFGAQYDATGMGTNTYRRSEWLETGWHSGLLNSFTMRLKLPMPFSDGMLVQLWRTVDGTAALPDDLDHFAYIYTWYEQGSLPSWPYSNWRLRGGIPGTSYFGTAIGTAAAPGTFINIADGPGMLVGIYESIKDLHGTPSGAYLEENWTFNLDGQTGTSWQTSGHEDLFGMGAFYFAIGQHTEPDWGIQYADSTNYIFESYRWFDPHPIMWTDGCVGCVPNSATNPYEAYILPIYYAP